MQINAFRTLLYLIFIKRIKIMMKDKYLNNYDNIEKTTIRFNQQLPTSKA